MSKTFATSLKGLRNLFKYIPSHTWKNGLKPRLSDKGKRLSEAIIREKVTNDHEAFAHLNNGASIKWKSYIRLRERLEEKALSMFLSRDFKELNRGLYFKKVIEAYRKMLASRLFQFLGNSYLACNLSEKAVSIGQKYQLYDVVNFCTVTLCQRYSFLGYQKDFEKYAAVNQKARQILNLENEIYLYLLEFMNLFTQKAHLTHQEKDRLDQYRHQSAQALEQHYTHNLYLHHLRLVYFKDTIEGNYEQIFRNWNQFIEYLQDNPHLYTERTWMEAHVYQLEAAMNLGWLNESEKAYQECLKVLKKGNINWFVVQENYTMALIREGFYDKAIEILKAVKQNHNFRTLPEHLKELWHLTNAYLNFAVEAGWSQVQEPPDFRLFKFLNETPLYSQDKAGRNTNLLIIQWLFYFLRGNFDKILESEEALQTYRYRYLEPNQFNRTNRFVKFLTYIPKKNFDYHQIRKATDADFEKLQQLPSYHAQGMDMVEIIPYEKLWNWVLGELKKKIT